MTARLAQLAVTSLFSGALGLRYALAAINRLKFALVEDNKVTVLPAALARRETNPAQ